MVFLTSRTVSELYETWEQEQRQQKALSTLFKNAGAEELVWPFNGRADMGNRFRKSKSTYVLAARITLHVFVNAA
jgi:hypothetical protein